MKMAERIALRRQALLLLLVCSLLLPHGHSWLQTMNRHEQLRPTALRGAQLFMTDDSNAASNESFHTLARLVVGSRLGENVQLTLTREQAHYVTNVMRIGRNKSRDCVRVFDGVNGEWLAQIQTEQDEESTQRKRRRRDDVIITARCLHQLRPQDKEMLPWLFFAPIKKARVKIMLEKCTELGVGRFVPLLTERTDPGSIRDCIENLDKLAAQTIEAAEQCERLTVPPLTRTCLGNEEDPWDLKALLNKWSDTFCDRHLLICRERTVDGSVPVLAMLQSLHGKSIAPSVAFVVGPEGGWSPTEEALCDQYATLSDNIHCVSLGSLVLRAETSSITAISACMLCQELYSDKDA
jgi:16S rRNA (uracil1498-N3)-methyltransferase